MRSNEKELKGRTGFWRAKIERSEVVDECASEGESFRYTGDFSSAGKFVALLGPGVACWRRGPSADYQLRRSSSENINGTNSLTLCLAFAALYVVCRS